MDKIKVIRRLKVISIKEMIINKNLKILKILF